MLQTVSVGRRKFSANFQLMFRLIKGLIFLTFVSILVTLIALPHMTMQDIIVCILAFMPTGWGLLLVSNFFKLHFLFYYDLLLYYDWLTKKIASDQCLKHDTGISSTIFTYVSSLIMFVLEWPQYLRHWLIISVS